MTNQPDSRVAIAANHYGQQQQVQPFRTLIYGAAKTRKTWWALKFAEAGYNVISCDGERSSRIISQIDPAVRDKITILDLAGTQDNSAFATFMLKFSTNRDFVWNTATKKIMMTSSQLKENTGFTINPSKFTMNDVLIIDSWSALMDSLLIQYKLENGLTSEHDYKQEWDDYFWGKRVINQFMARLLGLNCNLVVIGHEMVYEKWDGRGKRRKLVEQRVQPTSYSGPQGRLMAKDYDDVLYFKLKDSQNTEIHAYAEANRDGGSRILAPAVYDWATLDPKAYMQLMVARGVGLPPTDVPCQAIEWHMPSGTQAVAEATPIVTQQVPTIPQTNNPLILQGNS